MPDSLGKFVITVFVLAFGFMAWRAWQIKQASPAWPSVDGEMLVSMARPFNTQNAEPEAGKNDWRAEVLYRYTVDGVTYEGHRLQAFGHHYFSRAEAESALAPFPVGALVKVYHDPAKPNVSVLIPG
jgi:hypothetical protein